MSNKVDSEVVANKYVSDNDILSIENKISSKSPEVIIENNVKKQGFTPKKLNED